MLNLSHDALVTLATQKAAFPKAKDALDRLSFLVGPLFLPFEAGKQILPINVSELVETNIGLKLPIEVAEALMFRMAGNGYLNSEEIGDSKLFTGKGEVSEESDGSVIDELIIEFRLFVQKKQLLKEITDDEILHLFMSEVFRVSDLLNEDDFGHQTTGIQEWKTGLISDYILDHSDEAGSLPPLLTRLAELCLLRTLVEDLTQQNKTPKKSQLVAILDAPVALFAIGASGVLVKRSVEATLDLARSIGVRFVIYPVSIAEIQRVLSATLANDHRDRRGPTANAIRRGELSEVVADDMKNNPEKYLKNCDITLLPRRLENFPADEHFFSEEKYREFSVTASTWAKTEPGQYHDAECLALTMRARKGTHPSNILGNSFIFVTNNWRYSVAARNRCLETHSINERSCPPIVHLNTFSASIWLAGGFDKEAGIPEKTLLAACERTLSNTGEVMEKTRRLLRDLEIEDEATIELLTQDRDSVYAITSQVGNDPNLVNEQNISVLLSAAKEAVNKELTAKHASEKQEMERQHHLDLKANESEAEAQLREIKENFSTFKNEVHQELEKRKERIAAMESAARQEKERQFSNIKKRVLHVNERINKRGWGLIEWFEIVSFAVASLLMGFKVSFLAGVGFIIVGIAFVTLSHFEIWFPSKLKMWLIGKIANRQLKKEFSIAEIREWGISIGEKVEAEIKNKGQNKLSS